MSEIKSTTSSVVWTDTEKIVFRFFFILLVLFTFPLDPGFYKLFFSFQWLKFQVYDLLQLTRYTPQFIPAAELPQWGVGSFANWGIALFIALVGTIVWSYRDKSTINYQRLYYWLRAAVRYRLAIAVIAYGFIKLFPLQIPYPSLSNLHTNYGDFLPWKIYWHTIGIVPGYESFLGAVEIIAGILLLFRRTTTFGAGLILGFTGNVLAANFAYTIGDHIYSAYLVFLAAFLFAYDVPRLWSLLALQKKTIANKFQPATNATLLRFRKYTRLSVTLFILIFGVSAFLNYRSHPYLLPKTSGLKDAYGFYNVKTFVFNKDTLPYSTTDPNRWQNVVFEKWSTLSIKIARPIRVDLTNANVAQVADIDRNFESAGVGGRHYYSYTLDSTQKTLSLQNKNIHHRNEQLLLTLERPNDSTIVVRGVNNNKDSVYAVLEKINRKYMLFEGRRKPVKL